jgi:hypothetical protein
LEYNADTQNSSEAQAPADGAPQPSFDDDIRAVLDEGVLCIVRRTALTALRDRRLEYAHRTVLAELLECLNGKIGTAWPARETLVARTGLSMGNVNNALYDLRKFGYLRWERRPIPRGQRVDRHYVVPVASVSHDALRAEIEMAIKSLRGARNSHRPRCEIHTAHGVKSAPPTVWNGGAHFIEEHVEELVEEGSSSSASAREAIEVGTTGSKDLVPTAAVQGSAAEALGEVDGPLAAMLGELWHSPNIRAAVTLRLKVLGAAEVLSIANRAHAKLRSSCRSRDWGAREIYFLETFDGMARKLSRGDPTRSVPAIESNRFRDDETLGKVADQWVKGHHGNMMLDGAPAGTTKAQVRTVVLDLGEYFRGLASPMKDVVNKGIAALNGERLESRRERLHRAVSEAASKAEAAADDSKVEVPDAELVQMFRSYMRLRDGGGWVDRVSDDGLRRHAREWYAKQHVKAG